MTFLMVENVTLTFPMMERNILDDISYQVDEGDFVIVLGGNGSGKSSLLKLIDTRYVMTSGRITYRKLQHRLCE